MLDLELVLPQVQDLVADDVAGEQIGGELHPLEIEAQAPRQGIDRRGLGDTRYPLDQDMPPGKQSDDHTVDQLFVSDDDLFDLFFDATDHFIHLIVTVNKRL